VPPDLLVDDDDKIDRLARTRPLAATDPALESAEKAGLTVQRLLGALISTNDEQSRDAIVWLCGADRLGPDGVPHFEFNEGGEEEVERPVAPPDGRCRTFAHVLDIYTARRTEATSDLVSAVLHDVASYAAAKAAAKADPGGVVAIADLVELQSNMPQEPFSIETPVPPVSPTSTKGSAKAFFGRVDLESKMPQEPDSEGAPAPPIPPRGTSRAAASVSPSDYDDTDL